MANDPEDHVLTISTSVLNATGLCAVMAFANVQAARMPQSWNAEAILWTGNVVFAVLIAALAWVAFSRLIALMVHWSPEQLPDWAPHWIAGLFTILAFSSVFYVRWSVSGALSAVVA